MEEFRSEPFQPPNNHDNATSSSSHSSTYSPQRNNDLFESNCSTTYFTNVPNHINNNNSNGKTKIFSYDLLKQRDNNSSSYMPSCLVEAGIVEKLLPSYGFIQCCERQARLFFHYSQLQSDRQHLKVGDPVEFEVSYDQRTGKPIAVKVNKIGSQVFCGDKQSSERVCGFVTTELTDEKEGRIAYENRGECFFLPFTRDDLQSPDVVLHMKDCVTFQIGTEAGGVLRARNITMEQPTADRYQGVVCALKESFGFIERGDVVKEIFFHLSECKDFKNLSLCDEVEFSIQSRNGKEVAVNVTLLPPGTVMFEDVDPVIRIGKVVKSVDRIGGGIGGVGALPGFSRQFNGNNSMMSSMLNEPFPGRITYRDMSNNGQIDDEIRFGEKDVKGEYSLNVGDVVQFNIVTDRRDHAKHATNVTLYEKSFKQVNEQRELGYIATLKDAFGFIKCFNAEGTKLYFRLSEMLNSYVFPKINDEVEFTVAPDKTSPGRLQAIRIKTLPSGTILKILSRRARNGSVHGGNDGMVGLVGPGMPATQLPNFGGGTNFAVGGAIGVYSEYEFNENDYGTNGYDYYQSGNAQTHHQPILPAPPATYHHVHHQPHLDEFPLIDLNVDDTPNQANGNHMIGIPGNKQERQGFIASNTWSQILPQMPITITNTNCDCTPNTNENSHIFDLSSSPEDSSPVLKPTDYNGVISGSSSSKMPNGDMSAGGKSVYHSNNGRGKPQSKQLQRGFVAAIKDAFGFIEKENHQWEVFFHFNVFDGNGHSLNIGDEVEFSEVIKNQKHQAEYVRRLRPGTIEKEVSDEEELDGIIVRSVRCLNPEQEHYCGIVQQVQWQGDSRIDSNNSYEFSMTSLADIHDYVQKGDRVTFQLGSLPSSPNIKRAVNIKPLRTEYEATVDAIKNNFGFLNYEVEEGKKLFFRLSEVKGDNVILNSGDVVKFAIIQNQNSGKYAACSVVKQSDAISHPRPERLINKLKMQGDENPGPRVIIVRQPRGPDGSKGFASRKAIEVNN